MGLIYVSSESSDFMSALKSNLESGKETVSQLKSGSQKVVSAVDGKQLSGAAYTAGKGLFADLIIPTITRTTNAIEQIEQELKKYQNADKIVASEGELNEDKLNQQIQVTRTMKNSVDKTLFFVRLQTTLNPIASVLDTLLNVERDLQRMTDSFQQAIDQLQNQLRKLQDFNTQTSGLFANSLNELKIAMQGVLILNNTTIKSDGSYSLPKGTNKSYFEKIKKDVSLVIESGDQEIELIKETDSLEEINRKTLGCANIRINPYTGKKISQEEANKFKYAAWLGTFTNIGDTVMGAYYGNKGASRLDGIDDVGSVNKKSFSEKEGGATVFKLEIPEQSLKHADVGDFTVNPSTGKVSKMKGGGHGQANIDFLKENGFEVNIDKTYSNGVRAGNVPHHKTPSKRIGTGQSWFPENWTNKEIKRAAQHIANQSNFVGAQNGDVIFGDYNGVRVGVIKTDGNIGTIFPDGTKQP